MPDSEQGEWLTLGQLARRTGLARASLLNYERMGLLKPAHRSAAGYRHYGKAELEQLNRLRRLRSAGLSLSEIRQLLLQQGAKGTAPAALLQARLNSLVDEMDRLRAQQRQLARLLATPEMLSGTDLGSKAAWVALLRRAGFDEAEMQRWHAEFEADSPDAHAAFLRALKLSPAEAAAIRRNSRQA